MTDVAYVVVLSCLTSLFSWFGMHTWQYALNLEQYEIAQQLRNKMTEVSQSSLPAFM